MYYRPEIDGLRAIAVISVILFHSGIHVFSGGYVGVDVFFVISGYLITSLVFNEVKSGTFTFLNFYERRIARLFPSLIITLLIVFVFGFFFYDNNSFDNLGKEIFFSSIGAANILFAQGVNYFAQDDSVRPLIHLWSLGVEEQFYLLWPTLLIFLASLKNRNILIILLLLFLMSFYLAVMSVDYSPIESYFYPQYRAFELILGAFTALLMRSQFFNKTQLAGYHKEIISYASLTLIILPMFLLDKNSTFPGFNTLYPCIGAALFIAYSYNTHVSKLLSMVPLVFIGLISYPLYLYHQPIISYILFFDFTPNSNLILFIVLSISIPLSWLTFRYIEKPIRSLAKKKHKSSATTYMLPLTASLFFLAVGGMYVAKSNGFIERFKILNPFAYQVSKQSETSFSKHFSDGMKLSDKKSEKILFIGDSLLQQYIYPLSKALNYAVDEVDTVTRGGCILLKGVEFRDPYQFSEISCNELRDRLYKITDHYDYIVISQSWSSYGNAILNAAPFDSANRLNKWTPFISETIEFFKKISNNIIIIGSHVSVEGTSNLRPTISLTEQTYREALNHIKVVNLDDMLKSYVYFNQWDNDAIIIHPIEIWSQDQDKERFILHNKQWSFFFDPEHVSYVSTEYIEQSIKSILVKEQITNRSSRY